MSEWPLGLAILCGLLCGFIGTGVKIALMQCFFLKNLGQEKGLSILVMVARLGIDIAILFLMHWHVGALIAAAFALTSDQIYWMWKHYKGKR